MLDKPDPPRLDRPDPPRLDRPPVPGLEKPEPPGLDRPEFPRLEKPEPPGLAFIWVKESAPPAEKVSKLAPAEKEAPSLDRLEPPEDITESPNVASLACDGGTAMTCIKPHSSPTILACRSFRIRTFPESHWRVIWHQVIRNGQKPKCADE